MRMTLIDDDKAQDDFGYQEIKQYHIFVKKSVFKQLLIQEMKKPKNWWLMVVQCLMLIARFFGVALKQSFFLALFLFIAWDLINRINGTPIMISPAITLKHSDLFGFLNIYYQSFCLMGIYLIVFKGVKLFQGDVFNNVFSQNVFSRLHQQAMNLDEINRTTQTER